jgi:hypothetical protein
MFLFTAANSLVVGYAGQAWTYLTGAAYFLYIFPWLYDTTTVYIPFSFWTSPLGFQGLGRCYCHNYVLEDTTFA